MTPVMMVLTGGLLLFLWLVWQRLLTLLMFFQQEEYDNSRFPAWWRDKGAWDRSFTLGVLLAGLINTEILYSTSAWPRIIVAVIFIIAIALGLWASMRLRRNSKKPLVRTQRANRILWVAFALALVLTAALVPLVHIVPSLGGIDMRLNATLVGLILIIQALPFLLMAANRLLAPFEARVKARFKAEAQRVLAERDPTVIAITGSFGKTSTKHLIAHLLASAAPTLATPGSVNTEMGITRVIREQLKPEHRYFIVEMGAYGPGSIARLCAFTPPKVGVITAVGMAHYERFKTLETVADAKFELAEATIKSGGPVIVSTDGIPADLMATEIAKRPGTYIKVGKDADDLKVTGVTEDADGTEITVVDAGETHSLRAPLYGSHQSGNMALAAAVARAVGVPWAVIKGAMTTAPQTRHRLEVFKGNASTPTIIDDAYNANPVGLAAGLALLDRLVDKAAGGRRILITPGMVELGAKHDSEHARLGALAAQHVDILYAVSSDRMPTFVPAFRAAAQEDQQVHEFAKQAEAEAAARSQWRAGDAVLFANNLPDLFEAKIRF